MIIVDTSVAFKWFADSEKDIDNAIEILTRHLHMTEEICVPDLFLYEITNAWATKSALTAENINESLLMLRKYSLTIQTVSFDLLTSASEFAKEHHVSVYDATYAVLARENKCDLVTADRKFVEQVNLPFVKLL